MARKARSEVKAGIKSTTLHGYAVAIATSLLTLLVLYIFLDKLDILIDKGEICTRKHCRYWVTSPASIVFTLGGTVVLLLGLAYAAFTCIRALWRRR